MSEQTVTIKLDPAYHDRAPENAQEDLLWPVMDTVWNLLREVAAKVSLLSIKDQIAEECPEVEVPSEEVLFAHLNRNCPCGNQEHGWLDVAPDSGVAAAMFSQAYDALASHVLVYMVGAVQVGDGDEG